MIGFCRLLRTTFFLVRISHTSLWLLLMVMTKVESMPSRQVQIISDGSLDDDREPIDLLISFRVGEKQNDQRLYGSFSAAGRNYETSGDIVQVFPYRACDMRRKGYDRTLIDHIAVVFFDELEPFITGCVSLDNQVRFTEKSGALGLVVGPESRVVAQIDKMQRGSIPVVILDDVETKRLKKQLDEASQSGSVVRLALQYVDLRPQYTLRLQVFRPTVLNIGLIMLLFLLILFITGLVFIKIRWRPNSHRDIWLRTLARAAVNKMEIRKFEKPGSQSTTTVNESKKGRGLLCLTSKRKYLPVFGSLTSVAHSCASQERCSICLDEYKEGQELRVLFCGHEFHPKCVDPWLLSNRRCPLCQYDIVYKEYPKADPVPKNNRASSLPPAECSSQQDLPLLPSVMRPAPEQVARGTPSANSYMQIAPDMRSSLERKQRYRATRADEQFPLPYAMPASTSAATQSHALRENRRRHTREALANRISRRCAQHRTRSLGAQQRRRQLRPKRQSPAELRLSMLSRDQLPRMVDTISGYSSDISSYREFERVRDLEEPSFPYFSLTASSESSPSSSLRGAHFQVNQRLPLFRSVAPLDRISFEESHGEIC
uniref:Zinc/RING finger protein 3 n=1 Tax=Ascaris suum TaxID=6253 RepID=F1L0S7_ASCSU